MIRKLFLILISILIVAILLVPKEVDYFKRLKYDYGQNHHSASFNEENLKEMGDFEYRNRLIFSEFEYSFGNISVSYFGFLNIIAFKSSRNSTPKSPDITV